MTGAAPLPDVAAEARRWLFDDALPLWSRVGRAPDGSFVEALDLDGRPLPLGYKRVRVHARQVYVFSHAATLGFAGGLEAAHGGLAFLLAHGWSLEGGWVSRMGEDGGIVADDPDLYDQAFVILALSWWLRASGDESVLPWIDRTLAAIDTRFARADGVGFRSRTDGGGEMLQNPHMHLLEALLALHAVRPDADVKRRIAALIDLFETRLFDPETGTLAEYFDESWARAAGRRGRIVEPGHHHEWVWLLHEAERSVGADHRAAADALFDFAERHGLERDTGLIFDELTDDGAVHAADHRSWPQTERLKALLARAEQGHVVDHAAIAVPVRVLMDRYLAPAPRGGWIDHLTADGRPRADKIPASTLYHLFLAFAELDRCLPIVATPPLETRP